MGVCPRGPHFPRLGGWPGGLSGLSSLAGSRALMHSVQLRPLALGPSWAFLPSKSPSTCLGTQDWCPQRVCKGPAQAAVAVSRLSQRLLDMCGADAG